MYPAALAIVLIGIVLGIGLFVLAETRTGITTDYTGLDVDVNVTGTANNNATTLSDASNTNYELTAISIIEGATGTTLPTANYSYTTAGVVTFTDATAASPGNLMNITTTYTYDAVNKPETAMTAWLTGVGDFADWVAIIVVVIAAAIILGIVMGSFGKQPGI